MTRVERALSIATFLCFFLQTALCGATPQKSEPLVIKTAAGAIYFTIEVAQGETGHRRGLMFRKNLGEKEGMLFFFPTGASASMWMKNTYISLDMLFLDHKGTVLYIAENTTPLSEASIHPPQKTGENVCAVLEIKSGLVAKHGIKIGDKVIHAHF